MAFYTPKLFKLLKPLFVWITPFARFIPVGFVGLFIVVDFSIDAFRGGFSFAFLELAFRFLTVEKTIFEGVGLAIIDSPQYNFFSFINILIALYIMFNFVRFGGNILESLTGSQAKWGAYVGALGVLFLIEMIAVIISVFAFKEDFFIPIFQGLGKLIMNISPVITNIF